MTPNTVKKQRVPNSERRKNSIRSVLDSALTLFVTQGYDATSMDDIANQAGLTKGAVYFYFKDKLSLLDALLERTEAELFDPIFETIRRTDTPATERIIMLTNWFARVGAERPELPLLHVLVSLQINQRDNIVGERVERIYARLHEEIATIIQSGRDNGEFAQDVSVDGQAAVFAALIDGLLLEWHRWGDRVDGRTLASSAQSFILHGLTNREANQ